MKIRWYLGQTKGSKPEGIYLEDFEWQRGLYWAGGYISNRNMHCHFDGCFLEVPDYRGHPLGDFKPQSLSNGAAVWEKLSFFLDNAQYTDEQWWRIKDLFRQFYALKAAAKTFQYGGHCTSKGRQPQEINKVMAEQINNHIKKVIIPLTHEALGAHTIVKV